MKIYNTLTKELEKLPSPDEQEKINMFVCGPTVYDYIHIGNARTFVFFDVVAKYLRHKGYDVNYIQNITDIDNKIIERAEKGGVDPLEYAKKYTEIFKEDMKALGVTSPEYKNATDHIPEVIKQVQTLLDKGKAYVIDGDGIYFDLSTFPDYGKLSGRVASMADDAVSRIDDSDKKRNKGDFAIWKFKQHNDPSWPAPFGEGRPGWHIEDTAITEKYFGPQYDIHGGGQDLIFPHHEAEIAQQESASGLKPFVKYWMHSGFLVNKDAKMSKSAGNFETAHELLKKYPKEVLRYYLLSAQYHSPLDFNNTTLQQANDTVWGIYEFIQKLNTQSGKGGDSVGESLTKEATKKFAEAMDDDFNIPKAFSIFFDLIRNLNTFVVTHDFLNESSVKQIKQFLSNVDAILGIIPKEKKSENVIKLIEEMDELRRDKKFQESDRKRIELENLGFDVENTDSGTIVIPKNLKDKDAE